MSRPSSLIEPVTRAPGIVSFMRFRQRRNVDLPHRSEEHTSELQSRLHLVCRLLLEKKKHLHIDSVCEPAVHRPARERRRDPPFRRPSCTPFVGTGLIFRRIAHTVNSFAVGITTQLS